MTRAGRAEGSALQSRSSLNRIVSLLVFLSALIALAWPLAFVSFGVERQGLSIRYEANLYAVGTSSRQTIAGSGSGTSDEESSVEKVGARDHRGGYVLVAVGLGLASVLHGRRGAVLGIAAASLGILALLSFKSFMTERISQATHEVADSSASFVVGQGYRSTLAILAVGGLVNLVRILFGGTAERPWSVHLTARQRSLWLARVGVASSGLLGMLWGFRFGVPIAVAISSGWLFLAWRSYSKWRDREIPYPGLAIGTAALMGVGIAFLLMLVLFSWLRTL